MSGVATEDALGARLEELFPNLVKEGVIDRINEVLQSGSKAKLRLLHRQLDGTNRFQKRRLTPLRDGDEILVDRTPGPLRDVIHVVRLDETILVKRLDTSRSR